MPSHANMCSVACVCSSDSHCVRSQANKIKLHSLLDGFVSFWLFFLSLSPRSRGKLKITCCNLMCKCSFNRILAVAAHVRDTCLAS